LNALLGAGVRTQGQQFNSFARKRQFFCLHHDPSFDVPVVHNYNPNYNRSLTAGRGVPMGQVTIYLDNEIEKKLKKAAKASRKSVSKWVAAIISEKVSNEWPRDVAKLAGSWKTDFPSLNEIRSTDGVDVKREDF
jgi:hypothetical protein